MGDWDKPAPFVVLADCIGLFAALAVGFNNHPLAGVLIVFGLFFYTSVWCVCSILHNKGQWIYWSTDNWFTDTKARYQTCLDSISALETWHADNTLEFALDGQIDVNVKYMRKGGWRDAGMAMHAVPPSGGYAKHQHRINQLTCSICDDDARGVRA